MPAISRHRRDLAFTGHTCTRFIGVKASQFSVYANSSAILRPGDRLLPHTILKCTPDGCYCESHSAKVNRGSRTVFAVGKPVARDRDSADRGRMIQGSRNVFAG
jgi:uncharacterized Zn-binding protein involved in type VI secretion|tara:strand:- start:116 stop:427 length:312 start_codon:yes stop_codon:yes gene_type:complete